MRLSVLRPSGFVVAALALTLAQPAGLTAQQPGRGAPPVGRVPQRPIVSPSGVLLLPDPATRLEAALTSTGTLLIADYHRIDTRFGPNIRIEAVILTIPATGERIRGVRVQVPDEGRPGKPDSTSYIDIDELPALATAMTTMSDLVRTWEGAEDRRATILSFTTAGGLRVEIREVYRAQRAVLSTGLIEPVATGFDISDLPTLRKVFEQALTVLNAKGGA